MARATDLVRNLPGAQPVNLYKNNTDNKGASYGTHENYLMARTTPFAEIVRHLTPFFVTRQVVTGAGRVGLGQDGRTNGFQLSQRADFFEVEVGPRDHAQAPIINTRDEPHADPEKYRRLHVIIGDANLAEVSTYLKLGTTSLVLAMLEAGTLEIDGLLDDPVREMHRGVARSVAHPPAHPQVGPAHHRGADAARVPRAGAQARGEHPRLRRRRADRRRARPLGVGARPPRDRSDEPRVRARLGGQARSARGLPLARPDRLGPRAAAPRRPAVQRRPARQGARRSGCSARRAACASRPTPRSPRRSPRRPTDTRA